MSKHHGGVGTLTYARWKSMHQRCNATSGKNFEHYGSRGIAVCARWNDFAAFRADMGECPDATMTLDRLENDKGYEPGNCAWRTMAQQNANRSNCVMLTHQGTAQNVAAWAIAIGIDANTLRMRLRLGWTVERALTQPLQSQGKSQ